MIVKTFAEPTDIVLIGNPEIRINEKGDREYHGDFLITDDETTITFKFGDKNFNVDTLGFFNVFTMEQFNAQRKYIDEDYSFKFLFLPQFKGDIEMNVIYKRKEYIQGEGRQVVETHIVSEFPDENEYVLDVDRPGDDEDDIYDWDYNVVVSVQPTRVIVVPQNKEGELIWPNIDNYVYSEWDQTQFNGSERFQKTQMGHGFLVFEDVTQERGKRKDVIKGVTHEITKMLGKYLNAEAIKFIPYQQDKKLDKLIESMESGPFEAQLK